MSIGFGFVRFCLVRKSFKLMNIRLPFVIDQTTLNAHISANTCFLVNSNDIRILNIKLHKRSMIKFNLSVSTKQERCPSQSLHIFYYMNATIVKYFLSISSSFSGVNEKEKALQDHRHKTFYRPLNFNFLLKKVSIQCKAQRKRAYKENFRPSKSTIKNSIKTEQHNKVQGLSPISHTKKLLYSYK